MSLLNENINFFYKEISEVLEKFKEWRKVDDFTARQIFSDYICLCGLRLDRLICMNDEKEK